MRGTLIKGQGILSFLVSGERIFHKNKNDNIVIFLSLMRQLETFLGVRVITHCVMSNHFHILLEEPDPQNRPKLTEETLIERMKGLYSNQDILSLRQEFRRAREAEDEKRVAAILHRFERRMGNVSEFMKELKQRFSRNYNKRMDRHGTLWGERFKSVLTQGDETALATMAAYIDLNPVRAGMVSKPEDYSWSGYGAAVAGDTTAQQGLGRLLDCGSRFQGDCEPHTWERTCQRYRLWLFSEGKEETIDPNLQDSVAPKHHRKGIAADDVMQELERDGLMTIQEVLRCRVRYLTDGGAFGNSAFIEEAFSLNPSLFSAKRKTGSRRMRGAQWGNLRTLRDLRKDPVQKLTQS